MNDVRGLIAGAVEQLGGDDNARTESALVLAHVLGRSRTWLFAWPEFEPDLTERTRFIKMIDARANGEPIAYLTGRREFWSIDLAVSADVLIPRSETELLVELALTHIASDRDCSVADLGTGSGAIALALAHDRPRAHIVASDASAAALVVARANAERLGIANVSFSQGDWCAALGDARFDLIVSNPPYIEQDDHHLHEGDLRYEPIAALASGADGLDAIRNIVRDAPAHLNPGARLLMEHGWRQGPAVRDVLRLAGFNSVVSYNDLEGRERVSGGAVG